MALRIVLVMHEMCIPQIGLSVIAKWVLACRTLCGLIDLRIIAGGMGVLVLPIDLKFKHCKLALYYPESTGSLKICGMQESSVSMQQKLLEFEDEVTSERHLLEEELNEAMKELNKLHVKEKKAENLVKRLEQEIKSQDLELAQMKEELKGFVRETF